MTPSPWFVVVAAAQQEITTVWRLHLLGLEMFVPVIRRRIRTGRVRQAGITRLVARPMFPSYGFIRQSARSTPKRSSPWAACVPSCATKAVRR